MMLKLVFLFLINFSIGIELALFLYLIDRKVSVRQFLFLLLLKPLFNFICNLTRWGILPYFSEEIFYFSLSFLLLRKSTLSSEIKLFYSIFFLTITNLSLRMIAFFLYPLFNIGNDFFKRDIVFSNMSMIIPTLLSFLLIGFFKQSFKFLKNQRPNTKSQRTIKTTNFLLIIYFIIQHSLVYVEEFTHSSTLDLRKFIVIIYTILFFLMLIFLDRTTRDIMQEELNLQNNIRLKNLDTYNHKIEELYQTVRGFRHNYRNLLTTLKLGIDQEDMTIVKDIYTSILETSDKRLETKQFDLTQLINIQDNTLKSLLSAKFLQADDQNIDISLEIPSPITLEGMTILDFITVISILIDNAMGATVKAKKTKIMIAYIKQDKYQRFIIKNSTKEESISITKIFQKGFSSKGTDRGIGLASIREILEYYPNVSLNTRSVAYEFTQDLIIRQKT